MSAFVVDKTHVAAIVRAGVQAGKGPGTSHVRWFSEDPEAMASMATDADDYWRRFRAMSRELDPWSADSVARACALLTTAVVASVKHRYPDATDTDLPGPAEPYWTTMTPAAWAKLVSNAPIYPPAAMLKAIDGYEYQACELPRWRSTETYRFLEALRSALIRDLPGYEAGPWTIEDGDTTGQVILLTDLLRGV